MKKDSFKLFCSKIDRKKGMKTMDLECELESLEWR